MCNKCTEGKITSEQDLAIDPEELQVEDSSQQPLILVPPLSLSTVNLAEDIEFDEDEFNKGLSIGSYYSGIYTAFVNAGIPVDDCTVFVSNLMNVKMNLSIAEINSKTTIESSKNVNIVREKESL